MFIGKNQQKIELKFVYNNEIGLKHKFMLIFR